MLDCYPPPHNYPLPTASSSKPIHPSSGHKSKSTPVTPLYTPSLTTHASSSRLPSISTPISSSSGSSKRPKLSKKAQSSSLAKQRGVQASLEGQVKQYGGWQAFFIPPRPVPAVPPCSPVLGATRHYRQACAEDEDQRRNSGDTQVDDGMEEDSDLSRSTSNSSSSHHTHPSQHFIGLPYGGGFGTEVGLQLQRLTAVDKRSVQKGRGQAGRGDYFEKGWKEGDKWVEDVDVEAMDLDMS